MKYTLSQGSLQQRSKLAVLAIAIMAALTLSITLITQSVSAASTNVACADLPDAIAAANAGDTLVVSGECTLTSNTVINKQLTIKGTDDLVIYTNGTNQIFTITADNVRLDGLNFIKTDKTGV